MDILWLNFNLLTVFVVSYSQKICKKQNDNKIDATEEMSQNCENNLQDFEFSWLFQIYNVLDLMIELLVLYLAASFCVDFEVVVTIVQFLFVFAKLAAHWIIWCKVPWICIEQRSHWHLVYKLILTCSTDIKACEIIVLSLKLKFFGLILDLLFYFSNQIVYFWIDTFAQGLRLT